MTESNWLARFSLFFQGYYKLECTQACMSLGYLLQMKGKESIDL
jgi:hypothetical protein